MLLVRKVIWFIILLVRFIIDVADDFLGIKSIEGWICGGKVIGTMILAAAGIFLFVNFFIALAWAIC